MIGYTLSVATGTRPNVKELKLLLKIDRAAAAPTPAVWKKSTYHTVLYVEVTTVHKYKFTFFKYILYDSKSCTETL